MRIIIKIMNGIIEIKTKSIDFMIRNGTKRLET